MAESQPTVIAETGSPEWPFTIVADQLDQSPMGDFDLAGMKAMFRDAADAGEYPDFDKVISDVYTIGVPDDPDTWSLPHHVITADNQLVVNEAALTQASNSLVCRFRGTQDDLIASAARLSEHSDNPVIGRIAEAIPGVQMVELEVASGDQIHTISDPDLGMRIAIMESVANQLRQYNMIQYSEPTTLQIDMDQLTSAETNLLHIGQCLTGNGQPEVELVSEASAALSEEVERLNTKIAALESSARLSVQKADTLQSLLAGSPLEGVAESIISAKSMEEVSAYKKVTASLGVRRMVVSRKSKEELEDVSESGVGLDVLDTLIEKEKTDEDDTVKSTRPSRLARYV